MLAAILILLIMPFTDLGKIRGLQFRPLSKFAFYVFIANFLILMQLGAKHVESPFIEFGQISTVLYFSHFLIIVPVISLLENTLTELQTTAYVKENNNITLYQRCYIIWIWLYLYIMDKHVVKSILLFVSIVILIWLFGGISIDTIYCIDELSEQARSDWINRKVVISNNIDYNKNQLDNIHRCYAELYSNRNAIDPATFQERLHELVSARKDTYTNLNSEYRMLSIMERNAQNGNFSLDTPSTSTCSKRGNDGDNFGESSSKRK